MTAIRAYETLHARYRRIGLIGEAEAVLHWDTATTMPDGAAGGRADQLAELRAIGHGMLTDSEITDLIESAKAETDYLDPWQAANLREMEHRARRARALDEDFVSAFSKACSICEAAWRQARAESDFSQVRAPFEQVLSLVQEQAARIGEVMGLSPYDALLDAYEPGGRSADIDIVFDDLLSFLPNFLDNVLAVRASMPPAQLPEGPFPQEKQRQLGIRLMEVLGFDFERGRLDISHHPFCGGVPDDVRITTRYDETDFTSALMGVLHETGHALYEQGLPADWRLQPVGTALGMSVHESQSLLMEMQVCRSEPFLQFAAPLMREAFDGHGPAWDMDNIVRLYHKVGCSFIRVDADEVTYPLHVILRYRLEKDLLSGALAVADLPDAWNEAFKSLIGIEVPNDALGCLQDIHWYDGAIGYFPTYTLGAMTAAQLYGAACAQQPTIPENIRNGDFEVLLGWLRTNVHAHGRLTSAADLLVKATGSPLKAEAFKAHLSSRYLAD